jgi:hypothetical protein
MVQQVIIGVLFFAALAYVGYMIFKSFKASSGCPTGCGSCGVDFSKIEKELQEKEIK